MPDPGVRLDLDRVDRAGRPLVATVTLDRPDSLNAQTPRLWHTLTEIKRGLPGSIRVVIIRGAGESFSSGLDRRLLADVGESNLLSSLATSPADIAQARIAAWQTAFDWRSSPSLISVAVVQGNAIGAGFQLALGCDLRVLAEDATFAMAEATIGLVPDLGGTKRLVELVGYSAAADLCLTGRRLDAQEALRLGLASRVTALDQLDAVVATMIDSLLAVDRETSAEVKALLTHAQARSQPGQEAAERQAQYRRLRSLAGLDSES